MGTVVKRATYRAQVPDAAERVEALVPVHHPHREEHQVLRGGPVHPVEELDPAVPDDIIRA